MTQSHDYASCFELASKRLMFNFPAFNTPSGLVSIDVIYTERVWYIIYIIIHNYYKLSVNMQNKDL